MVQVAVWAVIMLALPLATLLGTRSWEPTATSWQMVWDMFRSPLVIYFANFYVFGPKLFFRRKYWLFSLCNLLLMALLNYKFFFVGEYMPEMPETAWIGFFLGIFIFVLLNFFMGAIAIGVRHFMQVSKIKQQLKDAQAKSIEAELAWLKNQINPHFLFNTLNNISSLTQIDPDAAQDSIAQLSDLLRYAMYETNKDTVPISGEVEFMRNYISLMKLRCNEKAEVLCRFSVDNAQQGIAPLLFISIIENAFKHGVSSSRASKIDINFEQHNDTITFSCDNTNYPKDDSDRSGSGIGLENTRRRLDLMYKGKYSWQQSLEDGIYHICISINMKK